MLALAFTTVMLSGLAAVPPALPPPPGRPATATPTPAAADPLDAAEGALRHTSNALLAKRRDAQMRHDRKGAQCYNQAVVRVNATLTAAHQTWRRAQALRRIGGTSQQHARIRDDAVDALHSARARVVRSTRDADICAGVNVTAPSHRTPAQRANALLPPSPDTPQTGTPAPHHSPRSPPPTPQFVGPAVGR